jgi:hypothetical protein
LKNNWKKWKGYGLTLATRKKLLDDARKELNKVKEMTFEQWQIDKKTIEVEFLKIIFMIPLPHNTVSKLYYFDTRLKSIYEKYGHASIPFSGILVQKHD